MKHPATLAFALTSLVVACGGKGAQGPGPMASASATAPASAAVTASASAPPPKPVEPPPPTPAVRYTGFATPESVVYDEAADRYLVSNIQGKPVDADGNGFISELAPDGAVTNLKWIEGGKNKVTLNAPKGMAIVKGVLYVSDLDRVRMFDLKSGAPKGEVPLKDATFANDVAAGPDGKIYVSDSGMKMEGSEFKPTGTDAVWVIEGGKAKTLAKSTDLGRPNGLLVVGKDVWVVTFATNELYRLDDKGARNDVTKLPKGSLDGIVSLSDGTLLVSSWEGSQIFRGKPGGTFEAVLSQLKAPADIGFDTKRGRVLVPRFLDDAVEAYDVK